MPTLVSGGGSPRRSPSPSWRAERAACSRAGDPRATAPRVGPLRPPSTRKSAYQAAVHMSLSTLRRTDSDLRLRDHSERRRCGVRVDAARPRGHAERLPCGAFWPPLCERRGRGRTRMADLRGSHGRRIHGRQRLGAVALAERRRPRRNLTPSRRSLRAARAHERRHRPGRRVRRKPHGRPGEGSVRCRLLLLRSLRTTEGATDRTHS
jgi:hypothetical protein